MIFNYLFLRMKKNSDICTAKPGCGIYVLKG